MPKMLTNIDYAEALKYDREHFVKWWRSLTDSQRINAPYSVMQRVRGIELYAESSVVPRFAPQQETEAELMGVKFPEDEGPDGKWTSGNDTAARSFELLLSELVEFMRARFEVLSRKDQLLTRQGRELQDNKRNFEEHVASKLDRIRTWEAQLRQLHETRKDQPNLGLATTGQLLDEIRARMEVSGAINYTTFAVEEGKTNE